MGTPRCWWDSMAERMVVAPHVSTRLLSGENFDRKGVSRVWTMAGAWEERRDCKTATQKKIFTVRFGLQHGMGKWGSAFWDYPFGRGGWCLEDIMKTWSECRLAAMKRCHFFSFFMEWCLFFPELGLGVPILLKMRCHLELGLGVRVLLKMLLQPTKTSWRGWGNIYVAFLCACRPGNTCFYFVSAFLEPTTCTILSRKKRSRIIREKFYTTTFQSWPQKIKQNHYSKNSRWPTRTKKIYPHLDSCKFCFIFALFPFGVTLDVGRMIRTLNRLPQPPYSHIRWLRINPHASRFQVLQFFSLLFGVFKDDVISWLCVDSIMSRCMLWFCVDALLLSA
jgi:hypothetical protein